MRNIKIKNVVLYCRVSTEMQEEADSLKNQISRCNSYCEAKGFKVVKIYSDVESGAKDERKEFQEMLSSIESGVFSGIVVTEISRISRKMTTLGKFMEKLQNSNIDFISITQDIDTSTLMGKTFFNLLGVLSEFERGQTRERVAHTLKNMAKHGKHTGGVAPYGYRLENKKLIVDPEQAKKVRQAYEMYISGYTKNEIIRVLKIPATTLTRMLRTPFYTGIKTYNIRKTNDAGRVVEQKEEDWLYFDGEHEAIIDVETHRIASELLEKSRKEYRRSEETVFLLKGLVKCYHGHNMCWTTSKEHRYYKCYRSRKIYEGNNRCTKKSIIAKELEDSVIEYMLNLRFEELDVEDRELGIREFQTQEKIEELKNRLDKYNEHDRKLINLLLDNVISNQEFSQKKIEIASEIEKIEKEIGYIQSKSKDGKTRVKNKELFLELIKKLRNEDDMKIKEHILHLLIYEIRFINDFEYKIIFKI